MNNEKVYKQICLHKVILLLSVAMWIILSMFFSQFVHAQSSSVDLNTEPQFPKPNEKVVVELTSNTVDLSRSEISWYVDDELSLQGVGEFITSFSAGELGERTVVDVVIAGTRGEVINKRVVVAPKEMDVIWEAFSYTPPFYKGKALNPSGGLVRITAMPQIVDSSGSIIPSHKLTYTWEQNGIVLGKGSGYGKQSIVLDTGTSPSSDLNITVTARAENSLQEVKGSASVSIVRPEIIFYKQDPLQGPLYHEIIGDGYVTTDESMLLHAAPYYFSLDDVYGGNLDYVWSSGGKDIVSSSALSGRTLELENDSGSRGVSLTLTIINNNLPFRVFQEALKTINLSFN